MEEGKQVNDEIDLSTFGANIHDLLRHGFFMNGTMGDYAKYKIQFVIDWLRFYEWKYYKIGKEPELKKEVIDKVNTVDDEYIWNVISLIGEEVVFRNLTERYLRISKKRNTNTGWMGNIIKELTERQNN